MTPLFQLTEDEDNERFDEEEEEQTLSTDTFFTTEMPYESNLVSVPPERNTSVSAPSSLLPIQQEVNLPSKHNPAILSLTSKFNQMAESNQTPAETERPSSVKRKSPSHSSLIQKQISLYERDTSSKLKTCNRSIDFADETMDFVKISSGMTQTLVTPSKTKSCVNLKHYEGNREASTSRLQHQHSGALIVKENFIEPPKRVTKSFHGKTELLRQNPQMLRFRTTTVKEPDQGEEDASKSDDNNY